jgi:hypothetical protein
MAMLLIVKEKMGRDDSLEGRRKDLLKVKQKGFQARARNTSGKS